METVLSWPFFCKSKTVLKNLSKKKNQHVPGKLKYTYKSRGGEGRYRKDFRPVEVPYPVWTSEGEGKIPAERSRPGRGHSRGPQRGQLRRAGETARGPGSRKSASVSTGRDRKRLGLKKPQTG